MIVNPDSHPQRQLYYLGAKVIEIISANDDSSDFFETYKKLKEKEDISIMLFMLTLDWLYLLGVIKSHRGLIEKCF